MTETPPVKSIAYNELHPADIADQLQRVGPEDACTVLEELPRPLAAAVLDEIEEEKVGELLELLNPTLLGQLLAELPPNAVADLVALLAPSRRRRAVSSLPAVNASQVTALLRYPPDTAGGIMSDRFIALRPGMTVQQSQEMLRHRGEPKPEEISYLYVTDDARRLLGILPLRELLFRHPSRKIIEILQPDVQTLRVDDDQEAIARQFEHYHFLALPVLDEMDRLVGVVRASDALEIAQAEATEDMQLMVGLSGEERALTPWSKSIRRRLPWLFVNLSTAFLAAGVISFFEDTIAKWTALAIFLPIIAGQGGNAGMQTLTIIIRDLALGELSQGDGWRALWKEMILGLINGLAVGIVVGSIGYLWKGSLALGLVATAAMVLNQLAAALAGVAVPFTLKALKIDPALASSIFVTTITDVAGFFFFLGLAVLALRLLPL